MVEVKFMTFCERLELVIYNISNFSYMISTFFSTATIGAVSGVFIFFCAFLPYIVIVAHDAQLSFGSKFLTVSRPMRQ